MGSFPSSNPIHCQIFKKMGHSAIDCYNRMNHAYEGRIPPQQLSTMISTSASFSSPNWLTYIGANAHITLDNGNLVHPRDYNGYNTIGGVVGGSGLPIKSIGHSYLSANSSTFLLNDVHHCPQAYHNLLSVHKFANDNHCSFTFFPNYFVIQDLAMKNTLSTDRAVMVFIYFLVKFFNLVIYLLMLVFAVMLEFGIHGLDILRP